MDRLTPERRGWLMRRVKTKNTTPEMAVRRLVFGMGFRYRIHLAKLPGKPDLVFPGRLKVVFVNGCFWHGHQGCRYGNLPKSNFEYWDAKIRQNRVRDARDIAALQEAGWRVLTVWQCKTKNPEELKKRLYDFLEPE